MTNGPSHRQLTTRLSAVPAPPFTVLLPDQMPRNTSERVFISQHLHVLRTINVADQSPALVDLALVTLEPQFNDLWAGWFRDQFGVRASTIATIA